jgi:hypothetical protein
MKRAIGVWMVYLFLTIGCINPPSEAPPADLFQGNFTYSGEPKLGQEFEVTFYIEPDPGIYSVNDSEITINIPEGLELISGTTSFKGNIKWKERKELELKLKAINVGTHRIKAWVRGNWTSVKTNNTRIEPGFYSDIAERSYYLFITSSEASGEFSRKPPIELVPQVTEKFKKSGGGG